MNILKLKKALLILLLTSISTSMLSIDKKVIGKCSPFWIKYTTREPQNKRGSTYHHFEKVDCPEILPVVTTKKLICREHNGNKHTRNEQQQPEFHRLNIAAWTAGISGFLVGTGIALYKIKRYFQA